MDKGCKRESPVPLVTQVRKLSRASSLGRCAHRGKTDMKQIISMKYLLEESQGTGGSSQQEMWPRLSGSGEDSPD